MKKLIDAAGAGASFTSPGWLTQLGRLWGGKSVRRLLALLSTFRQRRQQVLTDCSVRLTPDSQEPAVVGRPGGGREAGRHPGPAGRRAVQGAVQVDGGDGTCVSAAHRRAGASIHATFPFEPEYTSE